MLPSLCTEIHSHDHRLGTSSGKLLLGKQVPDVGVCHLGIVAHVRFASLELQRPHCGVISMWLLPRLSCVLHPALVPRGLTLSHSIVSLVITELMFCYEQPVIQLVVLKF